MMIHMSKRVTIMIDEDLDKKIRMRQAKLIQQEQSSYSYSRVLNETLRKSLKKSKNIFFLVEYVKDNEFL